MKLSVGPFAALGAVPATFVLAFGLLASFRPAAAAGPRFVLDCKLESAGDKFAPGVTAIRAVKTAVRLPRPVPAQPGSRARKWDALYSLEVFFAGKPGVPVTVKLKPAGSGDEDYLEYDVDGSDALKRKVGIQGAYINLNFRWAALINTDGSSFARCALPGN